MVLKYATIYILEAAFVQLFLDEVSRFFLADMIKELRDVVFRRLPSIDATRLSL